MLCLDLLFFFFLNIRSQITRKSPVTAWQRLSDFSLHGYLMCFVLQLAHLLARCEDNALGIRLKRFVFFSAFQLADLFPGTGADLRHHVPVQEVKSGRRCIRLTERSVCHVSNDVYLCLLRQTGTNTKIKKKKINPVSWKSSKSKLPVVFPPLAGPIYAVINAGSEAKKPLCWAILHVWTRWECVLEVKECELKKLVF